MEAESEFAENVKRKILEKRIQESKMVDKMTDKERFECYSNKCDRVQEIIERKQFNYETLDDKKGN